MAGSYTAGSLLVRLLPDARGMAAGVRRETSRIPNPVVQVDLDIKAAEKEIEKTRAKLRELERRKTDPKIDLDIAAMDAKLAQARAKLDDLRSKPTSPRVEADIKAAEAQVARFKHQLDELNAKKSDPQVDLDIANARAKLAGLNAQLSNLATKKAELKADADTTPATSKLFALRVLAGTLLNTSGRVDMDTDPAVVKLVRLASALGSLAMPAAIMGAAPFLLSLGDSAMTAAGGLWLLPAAISTGALAIGALKVATAGVGDALKNAFDPTKAKQFQEALAKLSPEARASVLAIQGLKGPIDALKTSTQDMLFSGLAPLIKSLGSTYLPIAEERFNRIAGAVNFAGTQFGTWLQGAEAIRLVKTIGDGAAGTFENLMMAVAPLGIAFVRIAAIGAPILAQLTAGAGGVAERFAAWTGSAQGAETIRQKILAAIVVVRQLWALAKNVGSIFSSVFGAAGRSGESFLSILVRISGTAAAALKAPGGTDGLVAALTTIRDITTMVVTKLVALWPVIAAGAQTFAALLQAAGPLTGVFIQLLVAALVPLLGVIQQLAPVLGPLLAVFIAVRVATGLWAATIGRLGAMVGPLVLVAARYGLLGTAAQTAALSGNASALSIIGSWIKMAAAATLHGLKIAGAWLLTTGASAAGAVAGMASAAASFLLHWAKMALTATGHALKVAGAWLLTTGASAVTALASMATTAATFLLHWAGMALAATGHALKAAGAWLLTTGASAATALATMAVTVATYLGHWIAMGVGAVAHAAVAAGAWLLTTGAAAATALATMAVTVGAYLLSWATAAAGAMASAITMAAAWFVALGPVGWVIAAVVGLVALIIANWDTVKGWTSAAWSAVSGAVSTATSAVVGFVSGCVDAVLGFLGRLAALPGQALAWFGGIASAALAKGGELLSWAASLPGRILSALGQLGSLLLGVGRDLVNGLWNGIKAGWDWLTGMVKNLASTLLNAAKSALGIASPSKLFRDEVGVQLPAGAAVGVTANTAQAVAAVRGMTRDLSTEAQVGVSGAVASPTLMWSGTGLEATPAVTAQLSRVPAALGQLPTTLASHVTDLDARLTGGVERLTIGMRTTLTPVRATLVQTGEQLVSTGAQLTTTGAQLVDSGARIDGAASALTTAAGSINGASAAIGRASSAIQSASSAITAAARQPAAPAAPAASRGGGGRMVQAEDGSWVPSSFYDRGGVATGIGLMLKGTRRPERVLSPSQTESYDRLGRVAAHLEAGRVAAPPVAIPAAQLAAMTPARGAGDAEGGPREFRIAGGRVDVGDGFGHLVDLKLEAVASDINAGRQPSP